MSESVSVIIPTLGRASLLSAVSSAVKQSKYVHEVIIIDASESGIEGDLASFDERVKVVRVAVDSRQAGAGKWTAAHNRNLGIEQAVGDWVAFLDDDDAWLENKLAVQVEAGLKSGSHLVSCQSVYRTKTGRSRVRPHDVLPANSSILEELYGRPTFKRLKTYVATSSLLVRREVAQCLPFPEELPGFEDTWWLYMLTATGSTIHQVPQPLVIYNADGFRSIGRDSLVKNKAWAQQLASVDPKYARNFLLGICHRNAALLGRSADIRGLRSLVSTYKPLSKRELVISVFAEVTAKVLSNLPRNR